MSQFLPEILSGAFRRKPNSNFVGLTNLNELRQGFDYSEMTKRINLQHQEADLWWKKYYYALRVIWATLTIVLLGVSLWFTYWLVKGVGTGSLNFADNGSFLNIIAGEIIINVLGLVAIVMHFLFPSSSRKPSEANANASSNS